MNQVSLNPTRLSILSISRSKYWLFKSALLELLYHEINKANPNESDPSDDESDTDVDYSFDKFSKRGPNHSAGHKTRRSVSSVSSGNVENDVDNSSKPDASESSSPELNAEDEDPDSDYFFHIAFTPIECTVICSSALMLRLFHEPLKICEDMGYDGVKLIDQQFVSLQVDSGGDYENHHRILELTRPLSTNNITLFFLSTHFSDIVLIPYHLEQKVVKILTHNGFEFSDLSGSYIVTNNGKSSPVSQDHDDDLEVKTFKAFKDSNIKPLINNDISLLLTGARSTEVTNTVVKTANNIAANNIPDYFAITQTSMSEVSLILPKSSKVRALMGFNSKHLIGSTQDIIVPVIIDLQKLPLDSTGIVAGVASKIINGINTYSNEMYFPFEMNYFSMARSAIIMVPVENIEVVTKVLDGINYDQLAKDYEGLGLMGNL